MLAEIFRNRWADLVTTEAVHAHCRSTFCWRASLLNVCSATQLFWLNLGSIHLCTFGAFYALFGIITWSMLSSTIKDCTCTCFCRSSHCKKSVWSSDKRSAARSTDKKRSNESLITPPLNQACFPQLWIWIWWSLCSYFHFATFVK